MDRISTTAGFHELLNALRSFAISKFSLPERFLFCPRKRCFTTNSSCVHAVAKMMFPLKKLNPLSPELILNGKKIFFDYISFKTLLSYNIEPKFKKNFFFYVFF